MRVLITGAKGFVGTHLTRYLLSMEGIDIVCVSRTPSRPESIPASPRVEWLGGDLKDPRFAESLVERCRPERIFHLSAQSSVRRSWDDPAETMLDNVLPQLRLFQAVRKSGSHPAIHIACSAEEYGRVDASEIPIRESTPLRPLNPYGVSKVAQDLLALQYHEAYGFFTVRTRAFNQIGPGQDERFAASSFAKQAALIEAGRQQPVIQTGRLDSVRDFTDVRDIVRAYWLALEKGVPGEAYNVCSGRAHSVADILAFFQKESRVPFRVETDSSRLRPHDAAAQIGDGSKFRRQTGWTPSVPFEASLKDLLQEWRTKIAAEAA